MSPDLPVESTTFVRTGARIAPAMRRLLASGVVATTALFASGGCEDSAARAQAQAQREIMEVADAFQTDRITAPALAEGNELAEDRQALGGLLSRLNGIEGAAPGQKAAADALASRIASSMGRLSADRMKDLAADMRFARGLVEQRIDAGAALGVLAANLESFDPSEDQALLDGLLAEARESIALSRARAQEMEGPVSELVRDNEASRLLLQELDRTEATLRAQARSAGPIEGFAFVEQAALKRDEADALRIRIARNELRLAELAPEQNFASVDAQQGQQIMDTLEGAKGELSEMKSRAQAMAEACRAALQDVRDDLATTVTAVDQTLTGPFSAAYGEASQDFEQAARLAQRAATPDAGRESQTAARLAAASAQQSLADVHWEYARALGAQAGFLERIAGDAGLAAEPAALQGAAQALRTEQMTAIEAAKAAATASLESVGQAGSASPEATVIKANLTALLDAMSGREMASMGSSLAGAPSADAPGFESPEALLAFLQKSAAEAPEPALVRSFAHALRGSSREGKAVQVFLVSAFEDGAEFISAVTRRFGVDALDEEGSPSFGTDADKLRVGEISQNKVVLEPTEPGVVPVPLVKSGGRWYIDVDTLITTQPDRMKDAIAASQIMQQSGPMLDTMRGAFRAASADVATRVRAGEFTTAAEAQAAFQAAIQERVQALMQNALGGMQDMLQGLSPEDLQKLRETGNDAVKQIQDAMREAQDASK